MLALRALAWLGLAAWLNLAQLGLSWLELACFWLVWAVLAWNGLSWSATEWCWGGSTRCDLTMPPSAWLVLARLDLARLVFTWCCQAGPLFPSMEPTEADAAELSIIGCRRPRRLVAPTGRRQHPGGPWADPLDQGRCRQTGKAVAGRLGERLAARANDGPPSTRHLASQCVGQSSSSVMGLR